MIRFALCLVLASLCTGCFLSRETDNEPVPPELLARLVPGETTASQAVELLGAPTDIVQLGRRSAYLYSQSTAKRAALFLAVVNFSNTDRRSDRAWLFFDEGDVLTHYGQMLAAERSRYAMPWFGIYEDQQEEAEAEEHAEEHAEANKGEPDGQ